MLARKIALTLAIGPRQMDRALNNSDDGHNNHSKIKSLAGRPAVPLYQLLLYGDS